MASTYLSRTPSSAGNRKTWTWSGWVKLGNLSAIRNLFSSSSVNQLRFNSDNSFFVYINDSTVLQTNALYRDTASWYHIIIACDTTQSTASNRTKLYVNGTQITSFATENQLAQNTDTGFNNTTEHTIGRQSGGGFYFDGYMAEIHHIDGQQLDASSFGQTDSTGIWKPKGYSGSYGTNGFYLKFSNGGDLGADSSGNANNFTKSGNGRQRTDAPSNNFATLNPLDYSSTPFGTATLSEGNCKVTLTDNNTKPANFIVNQGKWYWEQKYISSASSQNRIEFGIIQQDVPDYIGGDSLPNTSGKGLVWAGFGDLRGYISTASFGTFAPNDIIGCALDMDAQTLQFYKNGSAVSTAQDFSGAGWTNVSPTVFCSNNAGNEVGQINFGNPTYTISSGNSDDNGYGNFEYAPPTGFLALCTQNLATVLSPTIDDGSAYFQATTYTGDGNDDRQVTNSGNSDLQPDLIWVKNRTQAYNHIVQDTSRGLTTGGYLTTNGTQVESGATTVLVKTATTDGFTVGTSGAVNWSGDNLVGWQWKANGGTTSSNTDGSITSTVQTGVGGFSIVTYTGNGTAGATIGHGLGVQPSMIIVKSRTSADPWAVYHHQNTSAPETDVLFLNATDATTDNNTYWNDTAPTSSVYSVGTSGRVNRNTTTYVAYCFAEIEGYSKFGSYIGNGSTDGTFVYTGFRPSFVLTKRTDTSGYSWGMADSKRSPYNQANEHLFANASDAEYTTLDKKDLLSNGFKQRTNLYGNLSGGTYIYMAFAEHPFVTSGGLPVTAR
jgi:hypothetical protein